MVEIFDIVFSPLLRIAQKRWELDHQAWKKRPRSLLSILSGFSQNTAEDAYGISKNFLVTTSRLERGTFYTCSATS